ncbi:NADH:flavin oxidoreductase [Christiangramia sp.]|uniref:NADH:flavin oxidoreductase n=1 Tax=Christiangramia sp. TaxID=1931228 RepID=UPI002625069A|nr:NADH:flavin oxidoreductase [Christiangramia sp.]
MKETRKNYPVLFSEININSLTLKNRIALAPMTRTSAEDSGVPSDRMLSYYKRYAKGGFSLLISEGTYPDEMYSQGYLNQPGIANGEHITGWRRITDAVHKEGAKMFCQLMHAGALSQGNIYAEKTIAPSTITPKGEQLGFYGGEGEYPTPEEMSKKEIQQVKEGFVQAAVNAREAGFDGVEIHGANGYLLDQFLTDYTNNRRDEYGGSTENRVRLLVEVCQAVREKIGKDFAVGIRISQAKVNDYTHKWAGGEKDAEIIFSQLNSSGIDFLHVTEYHADAPAFDDNGPSLASLARNWTNVPVFANGNLNSPDLAEQVVSKNEIDVVAIGKAALANKEWALKARDAKEMEEFDPEKFFVPDAKIKNFEL